MLFYRKYTLKHILFRTQPNLLSTETIELDLEIIKEFRETEGCTNLVIANGFAYATCRNSIQIAELATNQRSSVDIIADDITVDPINELLFIQNGTTVQMLTYSNPFEPEIMATFSVNFAAFSGISAANCGLAVSGGAGGSDTIIFNYSATQGTLELATNGIPVVDNRTGAPDVFMRAVA